MDVKISILTVETAQLRPNPWNTNIVGAQNFDKLKNSIDRLGFFKPILVRDMEDGTYQILGGEHRWRAAIEQGMQSVPVGADSNGQAGGNFWFEEHVGSNHRLVTQVKGYGAPVQYWHHRSDGMIWNSQRGDVAWAATSDKNLKHDIKPTDGMKSLNNINAMKLVTFIYNDDESGRQRRGVIAQQLQKIDPCYVKVSKGVVNHPAIKDDEGNEIESEHQEIIEKLVLDSNPLLMDALSAIQVLSREISELRAENRDLRSFVHFE